MDYESKPQRRIGEYEQTRRFPYGCCMYRGFYLVRSIDGDWFILSGPWMEIVFDTEEAAAIFVDMLIDLRRGKIRLDPKLELAAPLPKQR